MERANLRGVEMSKRRRSHRDLRPETITTNHKWTGVRNPLAAVRFEIGDRVLWDLGDGSMLIAVVLAFVDDCTVQVRLENGRTTIWPTFTPRMRRIQTPDFDEGEDLPPSDDQSLTSVEGMPALHDFVDEAYYDSVSMDAESSSRECARRTVPDFAEYESTYPGATDDEKTRGPK